VSVVRERYRIEFQPSETAPANTSHGINFRTNCFRHVARVIGRTHRALNRIWAYLRETVMAIFRNFSALLFFGPVLHREGRTLAYPATQRYVALVLSEMSFNTTSYSHSCLRSLCVLVSAGWLPWFIVLHGCGSLR
jgi:hypothetical protein